MWFEILKSRIRVHWETLRNEFDRWYMQNNETRIRVDDIMDFIDTNKIVWNSIENANKNKPGSVSNSDRNFSKLSNPSSTFIKKIKGHIPRFLNKEGFSRLRKTNIWVKTNVKQTTLEEYNEGG